jgi:hypothetical protein
LREGLRSGTIDSAADLSELLIPNVREWYADRSDCGPGGDGDGPPMPRAAMIASAFAGSALDGLDEQSLSEVAPPAFVRTSLYAYNHDCNTEFRAQFTSRLRTTVPRQQRDDALMRLNMIGETRSSYYSFADVERAKRPLLEPRSTALTRLADAQHPVTQVLEAFWTDVGPRLASPMLTCPVAYRQLITARDAEIDRLRSRPSYSRFFIRAARERERR